MIYFWLIGIVIACVHIYFFTKWCFSEYKPKPAMDEYLFTALVLWVATASTVEHFCELLRYLMIITGIVK